MKKQQEELSLNINKAEVSTEIREMKDEELVADLQKGRKECFREIMERYEKKLARYLRRFLQDKDDIGDLLQEIFIKVYKNINSFNIEKRFSPWVYRIAHNEMVNSLKKKIRDPLSFFDPEMLFPHPLAKEDPQEDVEKSYMREVLENCLDKVDDKYKDVLVLRYFEDMDYKDIADVLKIPVVTVGVRLNRGKEKLKKVYSKYLLEENGR